MSSNHVRLSSGRYKGVSLPVPRGVRPTGSRVREALLDSWQFRLPGSALLELFAGSGAVGLEALGRGAESLLAVDDDPRVVGALERAFARWAPEAAVVRRARLPGGLAEAVGGRRFDLVFADPPYDFEALGALVSAAAPALEDDGELVVEHSKRRQIAERAGGLDKIAERRYGESVLSVYCPRK